MRLFGIETEYGIAREDRPDADPVVESMELVRAYVEGKFEQSWDYRGEDPHEDQRGFRAEGLQQDVEEEEFARLDAHRPFSFYEMKSDLVLTNGARFYNDHTHPEYSTPECRTLRDLVAHDRAGERIIQQAADIRNQTLGKPVVQLYKNNTDFHGHSYGCHDNYLIGRDIPFDRLVSALLPFLVTRQLFSGAGKVGIEAQESTSTTGSYQLSQRADFMETTLSVDTMHNRPILNTRDEPHADRKKYRRLHLIVGDANMCEYATALKIGTTRLVLDLIASRLAPTIELKDPVGAIKHVSRDLTLQSPVLLQSEKMMSGLDIQRVFWEAAQTHLAGVDAETDWILSEWDDTLNLLTQDRSRLIGRVDWVTKQWLLETFMEEENVTWSDPWLASLDLEYHNVNPARGLYYGLEAEGKVWRLCSDTEIEQARTNGPLDTRAGIRGLCVQKFHDEIQSIQWEQLHLQDSSPTRTLDMQDLFDPAEIDSLRKRLEKAGSLAECVLSARDEATVVRNKGVEI